VLTVCGRLRIINPIARKRQSRHFGDCFAAIARGVPFPAGQSGKLSIPLKALLRSYTGLIAILVRANCEPSCCNMGKKLWKP
jgi:hypothetical protein